MLDILIELEFNCNIDSEVLLNKKEYSLIKITLLYADALVSMERLVIWSTHKEYLTNFKSPTFNF